MKKNVLFLAYIMLVMIGLMIFIGCTNSPGSSTTNTIINNYTTNIYMSNTVIITNITPASPVGSEWICAKTTAPFAKRSGHTSVVFNSNIWVICGWTNDIWYSPDGMKWELATNIQAFSAAQLRNGHSSVVFNNSIWLIGGDDVWLSSTNDVWYSANGTNWFKATSGAAFSSRGYHSSVVFNGSMWVIGGYTNEGGLTNSLGVNDVWYSSDGTNWLRAIANAAFPPKSWHSSVVFNNNIWVIGGGFNSDVWYSPNGTNWYCANSSAPFSRRGGHTSVVYDNKIWVMGGNDGQFPTLNEDDDVWYSSDGTNWTCAVASGAFPARANQTSVVFNNKMWVIAGYNGSNTLNDVWYSQ
jgi:leucine-zipper-like transcriptional regulator 1